MQAPTSSPAPLPVEALHHALAEVQANMPTHGPEAKAGCTAITCFLAHGPEDRLCVYAGCCGDSQVPALGLL